MVRWAGPAERIFLPMARVFGLSNDLGVLGVKETQLLGEVLYRGHAKKNFDHDNFEIWGETFIPMELFSGKSHNLPPKYCTRHYNSLSIISRGL